MAACDGRLSAKNPSMQLRTANCPPPPPLYPQEAGLDRLALLRLPQADYPTGASAARALHRRLRQLGGGSLREGLAVVAVSEEEQRSLAAALGGVEPEVGGEGGGRSCSMSILLPACLHASDTVLDSSPLLSFRSHLQAVRADAEHILEAGLAPPDTATAASTAAAGDAAVQAQRASLERVFAAYGELQRRLLSINCYMRSLSEQHLSNAF